MSKDYILLKQTYSNSFYYSSSVIIGLYKPVRPGADWGLLYVWSIYDNSRTTPYEPIHCTAIKESELKDYRIMNNPISNFTDITDTEPLENFNIHIPSIPDIQPYKTDIKVNSQMPEEFRKICQAANDICAIVNYDFSEYKGPDTMDYAIVYDTHDAKETSFEHDNDSDSFKWNNMLIMDSILKNNFGYLNIPLNTSRTYLSPNGKRSKLYVEIKPDEPTTLSIYNITQKCSTKNNTVTVDTCITSHLKHQIGGEIASYKHKKCGNILEPIAAFDALNIHSKNIRWFSSDNTITYAGYDNFNDFCEHNEAFLRMCGFVSVLKYSPCNMNNIETFFLVYIAIVNQYPVIEQIIKMGHAKLFYEFYDALLASTNKQSIAIQVRKFNELVNNDSTGGNTAMRFPIYIGEYLIRKGASFNEYYTWRDIYELTQLTKEQFFNLTESFNYAWLNASVDIQEVANILKFDYPFDKLINYIAKQTNFDTPTANVITLLKDYLNMCDIMGVIPDKYPANLKKQHDDIAVSFKARDEATQDFILTKIGEACENYVIPNEDELDKVGIPMLFRQFTVVFPKTEVDFINEGNMQHNCVGSYTRAVRNGECVVFFIRKKESPDESFITAECKPTGLGQCVYSNNRSVNSESHRKFARYIANKIIAGAASRKIPVF